jgi:large subunit ribosomal protein L7/L12
MAFDKDAFLTALDSMTVLELNDLVKAIEEKFGVSAAAMAAPAAAGGGGAAAAAEEQTEFNVVLADIGANKVSGPQGSQGPGGSRSQGCQGRPVEG